MAIPQSISFDEDLLFELKHKAKSEGKGLSTVINEMLTSASNGTNFKDGMLDKDSIINNIIIINNNILLLSNIYMEMLLDEHEKAKTDYLETQAKAEEEINKIVMDIDELETKFKAIGMLTEVKNIELTPTGGFDFTQYDDLFLKIKNKNKGLGIKDVMKYMRLRKNMENVSKKLNRKDNNIPTEFPKEIKGGSS